MQLGVFFSFKLSSSSSSPSPLLLLFVGRVALSFLVSQAIEAIASFTTTFFLFHIQLANRNGGPELREIFTVASPWGQCACRI